MRFPVFTVILVKPVPENAPPPMFVTLFPNVTEVKPVQSQNAPLPMFVTLFGMAMEVKPVQSQNA